MTLKSPGRGAILSICVALVLILSPCVASAYTYTFRAYIDGESDLIIQGNTVQWHNLQNEVPGLYWEDEAETSFTLLPTRISTVDMVSPTLWDPWPSGGSYDANYTGDKLSNVYNELTAPLPDSAQTVTLNVIEQRPDQNLVSISQFPLFENDYTLIVKFNDHDPGGAAWYEVQLDVTAVPVPGAVWLLGSGLVGLMGLRRFRRG